MSLSLIARQLIDSFDADTLRAAYRIALEEAIADTQAALADGERSLEAWERSGAAIQSGEPMEAALGAGRTGKASAEFTAAVAAESLAALRPLEEALAYFDGEAA